MTDIAEIMARAIFEVVNGCEAPENMGHPFAHGSKVDRAHTVTAAVLSALEKAGYVMVRKVDSDKLLEALREQYDVFGVTPKLRKAYDEYRAAQVRHDR